MRDSIVIWAAVLVISLIAEGATAMSLVTIWFIPGAMVALTFALLNFPWWSQLIAFLVITVVSFAFTRPLASKYVNRKTVKTNYDRVIGKYGVVTETIDNLMGTGSVQVDGKAWTARTFDGAKPIEKGETVVIEKISGVKLIVRKSIFKEID